VEEIIVKETARSLKTHILRAEEKITKGMCQRRDILNQALSGVSSRCHQKPLADIAVFQCGDTLAPGTRQGKEPTRDTRSEHLVPMADGTWCHHSHVSTDRGIKLGMLPAAICPHHMRAMSRRKIPVTPHADRWVCRV